MPSQIGSYEPIKLIDDGGYFADVYLCGRIDDPEAEPVVVKWVKPGRSPNPQYMHSFQTEMRLGMLLDHPNIIKLHGFDIWERRPYIVMEYLEGGSLRKRLDENGRLSVKETVEIAKQICSVLVYCCEEAPFKPIVHRDLTPDNILFTRGGTLKVMDFGIAKAREMPTGKRQPTFAGWGKPPYMSPEALAAENADPSMDVFSLGVMMYEMLTGDVPYATRGGDREGVTTAHRRVLGGDSGIPKVKAARSRVAAWLCEVVEQSISLQKDRVHMGCVDLFQALERRRRPKKESGLGGFESTAPPITQSADDWSNKGMDLYRSDRYQEAIGALERCLELDPKRMEAWLYKGEAFYFLGRYEQAIEALDRCLELDPKSAPAWFRKGEALRKLSRYEESMEASDRCLELDPEDAFAWATKGKALRMMGRYEEAIKALDKCLELDPKYAFAWGTKSEALRMLSRYEESMEASDRCLELDPEDAFAWVTKGEALRMLGRHEEAMRALGQIP